MSDASHPLQAELEQQLRLNLELRAALDDCRQAATSAPVPLAAWQLPLLQLALGSGTDTPPLPPAAAPAGWLARLQLAWVRLGQGHAEAAAALQAELQSQLDAADHAGLAGLDLLNRVLDSQAWLDASPTLPPAEHSALTTAGFRLTLPLPPTAPGAAPTSASAQPVLFVCLHNGEQVCLSRPPYPEPLAWAELLALGPPWPAP
jgi:hypothetical protein